MSAMIDLSNQDFPTTGRGLALALLRAMGADIRRSDTATSMMHRAFTLLRRRHISMIRIDHRTPARGTRGEVQDWYTAWSKANGGTFFADSRTKGWPSPSLVPAVGAIRACPQSSLGW
jgi:hypothetical protein